jgi:2-oxoglutarate ferredoxin oxidoreductase subunit delta
MPKIVIVPEYCKSCMFCIEACPKKVIGITTAVNAKGYQYAVVLKPDDCVGCAICATVCPDAAIEVYK